MHLPERLFRPSQQPVLSARALLAASIALLILCLVLPLTNAEELETPVDLIAGDYLDAMELDVEVRGDANITLTGTGKGEELKATVSYVPAAAKEVTAIPDPVSLEPLVFVWNSVTAGKYGYRYDATVTSFADIPRLTEPIPYPFTAPPDIAVFLKPQKYTDTNPQIRALATELVGTEKDATKIVYNLAAWTRTNVKYDLQSIAADATKSSSWVYANREGVCDELTALFISLSREAGIPARFVSGLAYTTLPEFPQPWQAHGWAEVWLPDHGWVPVDIAYGEVFWLDAAHIPITRTADARASGADSTLRARGLTMQPSPLGTDVIVTAERGSVVEKLTATLSPQYSKTGSRSGNVIIASVTNAAPYTIVTDVTLLTTAETVLEDARSQMVFIPAGATRLVRWRVQMGEFDKGYTYTVPFGIAVRRGTGANTKVTGTAQGTVYPMPLPDDAGETGGSLEVICTEPPALYTGETTHVSCTAHGATVCADKCLFGAANLSFTAGAPGAYPQTVNASGNGARGHALVTFMVIEPPKPNITVNISPIFSIDDEALLMFSVHSSAMTDVTVVAESGLVTQTWSQPDLSDKDFALKFPAALLNAGENTFKIRVEGSDKNGKRVSATATINASLPASRWERMQLFFIHLFA